MKNNLSTYTNLDTSAGYEAFKKDSIYGNTEYNEAITKLHADEETQTARIVALAEKTFSKSFKKQYLTICKKQSLAECIAVVLAYEPKLVFIGLCIKDDTTEIVMNTKVYTSTSKKSPIKSFYKSQTDGGIMYCTPNGIPLHILRYSYDDQLGKDFIFNDTELSNIFKDFETETQKIINQHQEYKM